MTDPIKTIGYVSVENPFENRRAWSGTVFKLREAIEKAGYRVKWIPKRENRILKGFLKLIYKPAGTNIPVIHNRLYCKSAARSIRKRDLEECDALFFPGGAQIAPYLDFDKPVIYFTDAVFNQMVDYYWKPGNRFVCNEGELCESRAITRADIILCASDWCADCVKKYYNKNPENVHVLELGPDLDEADIQQSPVYDGETLRILFIGMDWVRKGGEKAIEAVEYLHSKGLDAELNIIGISQLPDEHKDKKYIHVHGILDKGNCEEYDKLIAELEANHIFLLPTEAECAGIVFSECSAFGMPIFTTDTGGVSNYVENGVNGYRLPAGSSGAAYGEKILNCILEGKLDNLGAGGKRLYHERLNYNQWKIILQHLQQILENQ